MSSLCPVCLREFGPGGPAAAGRCQSCAAALGVPRASAFAHAPAISQRRERSAPLLDFDTSLLVTAGLIALLIGLRGAFFGGLNIVAFLMPLPTYAMLGTFIGFLLSGELHVYQRYSMRFEPFDFEKRPVIGHIQLWTSGVCGIFFAACILLIDC